MARTVFSLVGRISMEGLGGVAKGLNEAEKHATSFNKQIQKVGRDIGKAGMAITKSISGPITVLGGLVTGLSYKTGQYADKLLDLSEATDLSTDTLQELKHVSTDAGVSFDSVAGKVQNLTRRLGNASEESGKAYETIKDLGIEVENTDGSFKSMNELFPDIIRSLQNMENRTERNIKAQTLFGGELKDLAPILGMTTEHFDKLRESAHENSLVMSEEALKANNDFRIEMDKLREQMGALWREVATKFIPILQDVLVPLIKDELIPLIVSFADKIRDLTDWFQSLPQNIQETTIKLAAFLAILGPSMLVMSKAILMYKSLTIAVVASKKAFIGLSLAMAANPFGLALVAIAGVSAALIKLSRDSKKTQDAIIDAHYGIGDAGGKALTELQSEYDNLTRFISDYEKGLIRGQHASEEINAVTQKYGGTIQGVKNRIEILTIAMRRLGVEMEENEEKQEKNGENSKKRVELTGEEIAALKELQAIRDRMNSDYASKIEQMTHSEIELLNLRENESIAEAERTGANVEQIEQYYALRREEIQDRTRKEIEARAQVALEEKKRLEKEWSDAVFYQSATRLEIIEKEYREALKSAEGNEQAKKDIAQYYSNLRKSIVEQEADHMQNKLISAVRAWSNELANAVRGVGNIFSQHNTNRLMEIDNQLQAQLQANELSSLSEEEKVEKEKELQAQADAEKRKLARDQAQRSKLLSLFEIANSTAVAIMRGFAELGPIGGAIAKAVVGGIGLIQAGLVAAQPLPSLDVGGVLQEDMKIQAHANEAIIPLKDDVLSEIGKGIASASSNTGSGLTQSSKIENHYHYHVGTLIGNEQGYKDLIRRTEKYRVSEQQRTGRV